VVVQGSISSTRVVLTDRRGCSFRNLGSVTSTHLGSWHQILDAVLPYDPCMHSLGGVQVGFRGLPDLQDLGLAQNEACIRSGGSATTARCQLSASGKGMVAVGIGEAGLEVGEMGVGATRVAAGIGLSFVVGVGSV